MTGFNVKRNTGPKWVNYRNETYYIFFLPRNYPPQLPYSSIRILAKQNQTRYNNVLNLTFETSHKQKQYLDPF